MTSLLKRRVARSMGLYSESLLMGMGTCFALRTSAVVRMPVHPPAAAASSSCPSPFSSSFPPFLGAAAAGAAGAGAAAGSRREQTGL